MPLSSAGLLCYRFRDGQPEFFLVHPGGPFWSKKDIGAWTIPKGEIGKGEDPLQAAIREMEEETGFLIEGDFIELSPVKQKSGKRVVAWAVQADMDAERISSNEFEMEWPPRSGIMQRFPEVDRAGWWTVEAALERILPAQQPLIRELEALLSNNS